MQIFLQSIKGNVMQLKGMSGERDREVWMGIAEVDDREREVMSRGLGWAKVTKWKVFTLKFVFHPSYKIVSFSVHVHHIA